MGREVKRVPLNWDYPQGAVWSGYCPSIETFKELFGGSHPFINKCESNDDICVQCEKSGHECREAADYCVWYNKHNRSKWYKNPPLGDGFQLWSTTTEGTPMSPVFESLESLSEWCAENATTFGSNTASKDEWLSMLREGMVCHRDGNIVYM